MTAADAARLRELADAWERWMDEPSYRNEKGETVYCADELRALVAEMDKGES